MEDKIMSTVESLFGSGINIVDCQTSTSLQQEEILLINGIKIKLDGVKNEDAVAIKTALLEGQMPSIELLNQLLTRAGFAKQPIEVDTLLTVNTLLITTEEVMVSKNGQILDEHTIETKENFNHQSQQREIWQPAKNKVCENDQTIKLCKSKNPTVVSSTTKQDKNYGASFSTMHGLNHTWSNITSTSAMSSSSVISDSDPALGTHSNLSTIATIGDYSEKSDSGHNGVFNSASLPTISFQSKKNEHVASEMDKKPVTFENTAYPQISNDCLQSAFHVLLHKENLNKLIELLILTEDANTTSNIQFTIALCIRLVMQPFQLLGKILNFATIWTPQTCRNVLSLLLLWLETCPNDFHNKKFMQEVRLLSDKCLQNNKSLHEDFSKFMQCITEHLQSEYEENHKIHAINKYPLKKKSGVLKNQKSIKTLKQFSSCAYKTDKLINTCATAKNLAQQLTVVEHQYIQCIWPEEFLDLLKRQTLDLGNYQLQVSSNENEIETKLNNIELYIQWFNKLSYLTATEVVRHNRKSQLRTQTINFWIEVAIECFNIGNFNSLMAILTGLNLNAVSRLKKTWAKVEMTRFTGLEHQMDPTSNYSSYRSTMKAAVWRSERQSANAEERAIIPFFTLFVKDLYFINENSVTRFEDDQINFEKFIQLSDHLRNFVKWKRVACPYEKNTTIISYLQSAPIYTEEELLRVSYSCEPPDSQAEKDHYKSLKVRKSYQSSN